MTDNKQILKRINEMLKSKNGLSIYDSNFLRGLKRYHRNYKRFSPKQIYILNEINDRYLKK